MVRLIQRLLSAARAPAGSLPLVQVDSFRAYLTQAEESRREYAERQRIERALVPDTPVAFTVDGHCFVCSRAVRFLVDFRYAHAVDGVLTPNWREGLHCPLCGLNNRMRATVHILRQHFDPARSAAIYITEQTTPLYAWLRSCFPRVSGSEYLGGSLAPGQVDEKGIRNEDLTGLSFPDGAFDFVLSFDVLEHVPDYRAALRECCRCLRPGGRLLLSAPFVRHSEKNIVRATLSGDGDITHLLPPEYHGDPLRAAGCLCFYHFGWEILDDLRKAGFTEATALLYWSRKYAYLGGEQLVLAAAKPR